jgi:hypothetical protein
MFVFVWKATGFCNARSEAFMSEADAWKYISDYSPIRWPDFVIEFNGEPTENSNFVQPAIDFVAAMMMKHPFTKEAKA